ncbi:NADP-dependent oxidoreductase [Mesorhizobium sp. YM1C-6-2]|uniref:NADP-dependent oxidoreductase n=1 Tax=Mesorhizobium sp. YM1C-6-2 TaxID=1827501 RepID=UPI000EF1BAE8|nr:NADP-dependent oxidoreductase [Mesorhizobium sp. YM1C-6-2]RLP23229.1 NADP-dependent oxidoreductase [Mesorhizobium sp. YM1C-6-2]
MADATTNRQIVLASRPSGEPRPENFGIVEGPMPLARNGEALLKTRWLSLDPYMRDDMNAGHAYSVEIGEVMYAKGVSDVVQSNNLALTVGDVVVGETGWQSFSVTDGVNLRKLDAELAPVSTALGVLGMPGLTAYGGLLTVGQPKPGETLVVAAAAGPVGSLVGQIAKLRGCRVVGIAGGPEKCRYLEEELGFDMALDHRTADLPKRLAAACPNGVDIYFENVGGHVWKAVFPLLNMFARVPVCGLIAHYNDVELPPGPDHVPELLLAVLDRRLTVRGLMAGDFEPQADEFRRVVAGWLRSGQIKYKEDVVTGLENAPEAFVGLLKGNNFGKLLVRVSGDGLENSN